MSLLTETRADTLPPEAISDELAPTIAVGTSFRR